MEGEMKDKKFLKYLIAILWLVLFLFFLISRFPYSSIVNWIEYRIEERADLEVSIKGVRLRKDLSLFIDLVEIKKDFDEGLLQIGLREVYFKPDIKMLIRGIPAFGLKGRVAERGKIDGRYEGGEDRIINLSWEGVGVKDIEHPWQKKLPLPSNPTNGDASLVILKKDKIRGSESIDIQLQGAGIPSTGFKLPIIKLSSGDIVSGKTKVAIVP